MGQRGPRPVRAAGWDNCGVRLSGVPAVTGQRSAAGRLGRRGNQRAAGAVLAVMRRCVTGVSGLATALAVGLVTALAVALATAAAGCGAAAPAAGGRASH